MNKTITEIPYKYIVFNNAGNYGQEETGKTNVDVLYTEAWEKDGIKTFNDLKNVIDFGNWASAYKKQH